YTQLPAIFDLGYPANPSPPFHFGPQWACSSRIIGQDRQQNEAGPPPLTIDCDFGRGASGGPWIADYQQSRGWGYVVSNNSYGRQGEYEHYHGPALGTAAQSLFNAVTSK